MNCKGQSHAQADDEELCVRFIPLSVLNYEAIVEEIMKYDYVPSPWPICFEVKSRSTLSARALCQPMLAGAI